MILGRRWDYLVWNRAFAVVLGDPAKLPPGRRNQMWANFHDPARRKLLPDWQTGVRNPVAGKLVFEHAAFKREEHTDQRLILYTPLPLEDTPAKLCELLAATA